MDSKFGGLFCLSMVDVGSAGMARLSPTLDGCGGVTAKIKVSMLMPNYPFLS